MCGPTVNYILKKYDATTEILDFECDKNFRGATTSLHQQNSCMPSGIKFVTSPFLYH